MTVNTEVSQEDFAVFDSVHSPQTDANAGCDLDFYSSTSADNVFTK
jgi:hypothetical protein